MKLPPWINEDMRSHREKVEKARTEVEHLKESHKTTPPGFSKNRTWGELKRAIHTLSKLERMYY